MMPAKMKKRLGFAIIAIAIGALLMSSGTIPLLSILTADTDGEAYKEKGILGRADVLDADAYVTSWKSGGLSEKIVIEGWFRLWGQWPDRPIEPLAKEVWYTAKMEGSGAGVFNMNGQREWTSKKYPAPSWPSDNSWDWVSGPSVVLEIRGGYVGKISIELWLKHTWQDVPLLTKSSEDLYAKDEAYLRSGIGKITVNTDVVEEGDSAKFQVETGYAQSAKEGVTNEGWSLLIYNPYGDKVWEKTINDNWRGVVSWPVPIGSYRTTWDNEYDVVLRNILLNQDQRVIFVIGVGMIENIPEKPSIKLIEGNYPYVKGEVLRFRIESVPVTYPIAEFRIWVAKTTGGAVYEYQIEDARYPANFDSDSGKYYAEVELTVETVGGYEVWADAIDTAKLNSGKTVWTFYAFEDEGGAPLGGIDPNLIILVVGAIAVLVALIAGFIIFTRMNPLYGLIILLIALGGLVALALWYIGQTAPPI